MNNIRAIRVLNTNCFEMPAPALGRVLCTKASWRRFKQASILFLQKNEKSLQTSQNLTFCNKKCAFRAYHIKSDLHYISNIASVLHYLLLPSEILHQVSLFGENHKFCAKHVYCRPNKLLKKWLQYISHLALMRPDRTPVLRTKTGRGRFLT